MVLGCLTRTPAHVPAYSPLREPGTNGVLDLPHKPPEMPACVISVEVEEFPGDEALRSLSVNGVQLSHATVLRSELLQQILSVDGKADVNISTEAFEAWRGFGQSAEYTPSSLAVVLQAASFLGDRATADETARRLAAAVRSPVRCALTNLPSFILPYLPAASPPPPTPDLTAALAAAAAALATLSHDDLAAVLSHLHPLELPYLPKPLLHTALHPYATSGQPLDLRHPLSVSLSQAPTATSPSASSAPPSTVPYWDGYCHRLLRLLADRGGDPPVATLALSHVNHITASYLRPLAHALRDLQLTSPHRALHISFVRCATALTRLGIVSQHTPQASLIGALLPLCHLRHLEIVLPKLTPADTSQLRSRPGALASGRLSSAVVNIFALSNSLSNVTHAHLRVPSSPVARDSAFWPLMLAQTLPLSDLMELTCYPIRPLKQGFASSEDRILSPLGSDSLQQLTALHLALPATASDGLDEAPSDNSADSSELYELVRCRPVVRAVCCAADGEWQQLRQLSIDCHTCAKTDLRAVGVLTRLQGLTLTRLPGRTAVSVSKHLSRLGQLRDLHLGQHHGPEDEYPGDLSGGIGTLPLTRLELSGVALTTGILKMIAWLRELQALTWRVGRAPDAPEEEVTAEVEAAFVAMLVRCASLTSLHMPFPVEPWEAPRAAAALASLRQLRTLAMAPLAATGGHAGSGFDRGGWRVPPWVSSLSVDLSGGDAGALLCVLSSISTGSARMTRLDLRCPGSLLTAEGCQGALAAALRHLPRLEALHLPGECLRGPGGRDVVPGALRGLTRLQQLALPGYKGNLDRLWETIRELPLQRGISGLALSRTARS
eukprot:jgi/Ulvmu1/2251/UM013_0098.1